MSAEAVRVVGSIPVIPDIETRIIAIVESRPGIGVSELAREIGLCPSAIRSRVRKMALKGCIDYRVESECIAGMRSGIRCYPV